MNPVFEKLKAHLAEASHDFGDGTSVLTLLYEVYPGGNRMDDEYKGGLQ